MDVFLWFPLEILLFLQFSWRNVPAYNQVREDFNLMKDCTNKDDIDDCILNCELYLSYLHAVRREKVK